MRINKLFTLALSALMLTSCAPKSNFPKVIFQYQEKPALLKISGEELYDLTINQTKSLAVFYSIQGCSNCNYLKQQMQGYAQKEHCNIYYVDMTTTSEEDYQYIVDACRYANAAHEFPAYGEQLYLPFMHIFAYQGVVITFSDRFIDNLQKYSETSHA